MEIEIKEISQIQKDIKEIKQFLIVKNEISIKKEQPTFVNKKYLVENFNLKISFIDKLMKNNILPYYKIGKKVSFKLSEIKEFIETNKKK